MSVYLSGPMTGKPQWNYPEFNYWARKLRSKGIAVVNPAELNPDTDTPWAQCMRTDIKALCDCDGLALLPGWQYSKGAQLELQIAHRLELKIDTVENWFHELV